MSEHNNIKRATVASGGVELVKLSMEEADRRGYVSVTMAYTKHEEAMLRKAVADMKGADVVLVPVAHGLEIWRAKGQVRDVESAR